MARGWESKSVESQIEDAQRAPERQEVQSSEAHDRLYRKKGLELDRKRVARELDETHSTMRRTSLQHALAFLDSELSKLDRD